MENISYAQENTINIFVPMTLKKRGGAAMVILPKNAPNAAQEKVKTHHDYKLINTLAKAYKWRKNMLKNSKQTIDSIAEKENLTSSHVGRVLRLNYLAPDIVKAILDGKQPRDLKIKDMMRNNIPDLWQEQKEAYDFN